MLRWVGKLLLVVLLFSALVATDSFARSFQPQRPHKTWRARRIPCRPLRLHWLDTRHNRSNSVFDLTNPCQASQALTQSLKNLTDDGSSNTLDENLLSSGLTQTFSSESVQDAIEQSIQDVGQIVNVEANNDLSLFPGGEWLTQTVTLTTDQGVQQSFLVVYHLEGGEWKLFGTQKP